MLQHMHRPENATRRRLIRRKRGQRLICYVFHRVSFRFLGSGLRILGLCICVCTLVNFIVYLTMSRFMDLITNPELVRDDQKILVRNLTWHIGPNLSEDDRRSIVLYGYPYTDTSAVESYLNSHPRVAWFSEDVLERSSARLPHVNISSMTTQLFNCSGQGLVLFLELVNNETASRRELQWCLSQGGSGGAETAKDSCRLLTRKQLRSFCLQHHVAVKLARTVTLQQVLVLLPSSHLKVLHLLEQPLITRNLTKRLLFSSRTQRLRRFYRSVIIKSKQKHSCRRLKQDLDFILTEHVSTGAWRYQRFPVECFIADPVSCALEMFNFLDIYVTEGVIRSSEIFSNVTSVTSAPVNRPSYDISRLTEESSLERLQGIVKYVCQGEKDHSLS